MAYSTDVTLLSSATYTANVTAADGTSTAVDTYRKGTFILNCSAVSGGATVDVAIQSYINGYWTDIARFAQVSTVTTRVLWNIGGDLGTGTTTIEEATQDLAITVSTKRAGPWGTHIRATYTIAAAGSITFTVVGVVSS